MLSSHLEAGLLICLRGLIYVSAQNVNEKRQNMRKIKILLDESAKEIDPYSTSSTRHMIPFLNTEQYNS